MARLIYLRARKRIIIQSDKYRIVVEYGDILAITDGKKVINFDECFTTDVGDKPFEIKKESICGQFLERNPELDIKKLLESNNVMSNSRIQKKKCYEPGTIVPYNDFLLMAFAKIDKDGLGMFSSRDEYLACLSKLWRELDKYYGQQDVFIPVLGAGLTRIGTKSGDSPSKQELVNIIVGSYKLSSSKIKKPYSLHIVCSHSDDFSFSKIDGF